MKRREFAALVGSVAAVLSLGGPVALRRARAADAVKTVGLLSPFTQADTAAWHDAFVRGLADLGWINGKNIDIAYRYANGKNDQLPALIAELQRLKVDVIVTAVTNDTLVAKNAVSDVPIVMAAAGDPVATGIVQSLSRPGGNVTGLSQMNTDLSGKRLELLKQIAPNVSRVAILLNPEDPISLLGLNELRASAPKLNIEVRPFEIRSTAELEGALRDASAAQVNALAIMPNPVFVVNLKRIADFALEKRLPSVFHLREFANAGGLMTYGVDRIDMFRRAAVYVDKILKGAKPADLPIEQPTKFELVINLKTAKALGLTVPQSLIATADQVIE